MHEETHSIIVFFPEIKFDWKKAFYWAKDRNYCNSIASAFHNPKHWDREHILKQCPPVIGEGWFCFEFYLCFDNPQEKE